MAVGGAIALPTISAITQGSGQAAGDETTKIVVVGGGIAGLNAAYQLKKMGFTAKIYEAKSFVGGRMQSRTGLAGEGLTNDLGGSFINSEHEDVLALAEELGVVLYNRMEDVGTASTPATAYYFDGRQISEREMAVHLQPLADQINADAALLDEDFDTYGEIFDQLSVADYLDQHADKILVPYVRVFVEMGIRTEYGVEPEHSSLLQLLYNLPTVDEGQVDALASDEMFYVKDGTGKLITELASQLEGQIYTESALQSLTQTAAGSYELSFGQTDGSVNMVEADYVILAVPFQVLRSIDLQIDLPETLQRFIQEVNLGYNEKLFVGFRDRPWRQENGFLLDAWSDLGFAAAWEETQRQPEQPHGALTLFLSSQEVLNITAESLVQGQHLISVLDAMVPGMEAGMGDRTYRTDWLNDPYIGGGYTSFSPGQYWEFSEFMYIESDDPEERVDVHIGNLVFAGEHLSDEYYGYMNGAAQTGRLAAEVVINLMASA